MQHHQKVVRTWTLKSDFFVFFFPWHPLNDTKQKLSTECFLSFCSSYSSIKLWQLKVGWLLNSVWSSNVHQNFSAAFEAESRSWIKLLPEKSSNNTEIGEGKSLVTKVCFRFGFVWHKTNSQTVTRKVYIAASEHN